MSDNEILIKSIKKAVEGGFKWTEFFSQRGIWIKGSVEEVVETLLDNHIEGALIFDRDFAEALWPGNSKMAAWAFDKNKKITTAGLIPLWQYHTQQMVIADNKLKYLGENI